MKRIFRAIYHHLPLSLQHKIFAIIYRPLRRSKYANIFHCTTQRAGSQWIRRILSDKRVYAYSGLIPFHYEASLPGGLDPRRITERVITHPFPKRAIATPLYIDYKGYKLIPKSKESKAIFVVRDPRDLVVSEYFSWRYSHSLMGDIPELRRELNALSKPEGFLYVLEFLHSYGTFDCQRSWIEEGSTDPEVLIVRFEDLITEHSVTIWKVFEHFDIQVPNLVLSQLLQDHSFESLSGRRRGIENKHSHYRKGVHGDWKNYFDERLVNRFKQLTGELVVRLGYELINSW